MDSASRYSEVNLLADPIHGYVEITSQRRPGRSCERDLIDSPWVQRLRRIHQLQSAWWVYPSAEHSRFPHSLGSMHLAGRIQKQIDQSLRASCADVPSPALAEETLRIAGLLHDVGHGPFGHFFDHEVSSEFGIDHEDIGRLLTTQELGDVINNLEASPSGPFAPGERIDPRWVSWVMAPADLPGYEPPEWLQICKPILCGPATADNMDYVPRDAYMCGVSVGPVDLERLIHYTFVLNGEMVMHNHAAGALEMFLTARLYMYTQVYLHRTGRRIDLSMHEVFADTIGEILPGNPLKNLDGYLELTDWSVLETVHAWRAEAAGSKRRKLADAWARIVIRDLPWKMAYQALARHDVELSDLREMITSALPPERRGVVFQVDVISANIAPQNPMTDDGLIAIYDPLHKTVQRSKTKEMVARLPRYNQTVMVFTNDSSAVDLLRDVSEKVFAQITDGVPQEV